MAITLFTIISGKDFNHHCNKKSCFFLLLLLLTEFGSYHGRLPNSPIASTNFVEATTNLNNINSLSSLFNFAASVANKTKQTFTPTALPPVIKIKETNLNKNATSSSNISISNQTMITTTTTSQRPSNLFLENKKVAPQQYISLVKNNDSIDLKNVNITSLQAKKETESEIGKKFLVLTRGENRRQKYKYKLPSWFNYELYKRFYGKPLKSYLKKFKDDNEIHKRIYLRTALKVFEQRALYRAGRVHSLQSINELSDMVRFFLIISFYHRK